MTDKDRQAELQRFAEVLIRRVRDRAIAECDRLVSGGMAGPDGERWRNLIVSQEAAQAVREVIPEVVDETLFCLLDAIDSGRLPLGWRVSGDSFVGLDDLGLGDMAGCLMGSPGWRHEFSSQRCHDPFSNLRLKLEPEPTKE